MKYWIGWIFGIVQMFGCLDLRMFGVGEKFLNVSKLGTKWDFKGTVICSMGREPYIVLSFVHKDIEEKISGQT